MPTVPALQLTLELPEKAVAGFASLLQHGILFAVDRPIALLPFLLALPGFTAEYLEQTVQTIFIDGVAADTLERELPAGTVLALSAAMPGLAGAIFRRQGLHSMLRSQPAAKQESTRVESGFVTLKLFNTIAVDRVHDLLPHGILVTSKTLRDFAGKREDLFQPPARLIFEGQPVTHADLLGRIAECPFVAVQTNLLSK